MVLGGAGFLGQNLCNYLANAGYDVYCFDIVCSNIHKNMHYIVGDFFDDDLRSAIEGKDCIIHAISTVNPGNSNMTYMQGYERDFLQTIKLYDMLCGKNIKVIFLSFGGTVYGNHEKQPVDENTLPHPINHYGNIKFSIENAMRAFNYQMYTHFIIARLSNPYGHGQDFHKGVGFIDAALKNTIRGLPVEIWGDGENIRDYVYIDDVCEMLECLIEYSGEEDTFNISTGIGMSQNGIIEILKEIGLSPEIVYKERRSVDVRKIILNNSKIQNIWKKKTISLESGIKMYYKYLEHCAW